MGAPFQVLMICTGNVYRSPAAEWLLRRALGPDASVAVASAGTDPAIGSGIAPTMDELLLGWGVDAREHRARLLSEADVRCADLVLGMAREHRSAAVRLHPSAVRRSHTLLGFAAVAAAVPAGVLAEASEDDSVPGRLHALLSLVPRYRSVGQVEDLVDPLGLDERTCQEVFADIAAAVSTIAGAVRG